IFGDQDQTAGRYIPGKLFEYMAIGRPILGLLKSGEASALIQRLGLGFHADPESVEAIEQALRDIVTRFRKGELLSSEWTTSERMEPHADKARHEALLPFRRDEQAKMFYRLFQSLVNTDKQ
ncbi:MAG: glycosyl transferase family 1, partial [Candidatus Carbobacillus sp.]|nr:glycosyl transferase family 1 [Candidatus Carbobacillus sp.]